VTEAGNGSIIIGLSGFTLVRIDPGHPPTVTWSDPDFGTMVKTVMDYQRRVRRLQENRGASTFGLRGELRDDLGIDPILSIARRARCSVDKRGGLRAREYYLSHLALGEFVRLTVFRGQSHVVDVAFSSPKVFMPLRFLVELEATMRREAAQAAKAAPVASPGGQLRPQPKPRLAAFGPHTGLVVAFADALEEAGEAEWRKASARLAEELHSEARQKELLKITKGLPGRMDWRTRDQASAAKSWLASRLEAFLAGLPDSWILPQGAPVESAWVVRGMVKMTAEMAVDALVVPGLSAAEVKLLYGPWDAIVSLAELKTRSLEMETGRPDI
jgi:hypothetical protein